MIEEQIMSPIAIARTRHQRGAVQFGRRLSQLFLSIELALQVRRERRMLAGLSEGMLKDLGLTRADVTSESSRAIWDVPANRQ
jgi:uncharacterized protein YjiS (DUF1127 family)